jgi:hypothetical protein
VAEAESSLPTHFQNNIQADPRLNADFTLQSTSPCIDAGAWLTNTNGVGSGSNIKVHDAGYFCDGFNLIDGDRIMVGSNEVTVTNVNYDTNTLTVTPSISWSNNAPVSLTYNGNAPDIGAFESGGSDSPPPDPDGDNIPPQITDINLIESAPLDTDTSFGWIDITATVTDNSGVDYVYFNVNCPNGNDISVPMDDIGSNTYYCRTTTIFTNIGNYNYNIWAIDTSGNPVTSTRYYFTMPPNWDIDMNGVCNVLDLTLISNNYDTQGENGWLREDVDNNGRIGLLDFVVVSAHFYETW